MKITQAIIRQIIKEELQKVISEDLYASEREYREAVEQFMKDNNVSKEEAEKAIKAAGEEMDKEYPMHGRYIEKEKSDLEAYKFFMKLAKIGREKETGNYFMDTDSKAEETISDFKINLQDYTNKHKYYKQIHTGYEFCKNKILDRYGRFSKAGAAIKKLDKPLLQRDLGAALELSKLEPQLKDEIEQRNYECEENLVLALRGAEELIFSEKQKERQSAEYNKQRSGQSSQSDEKIAFDMGFNSVEDMYNAYNK